MKDPSRRLIGKPKLAAALAALKRGLREDADPLYDTWKHPRPRRDEGPAADASPAIMAREDAPAPPEEGPAMVAPPEDGPSAPIEERVADVLPPTSSSPRPMGSDTVPARVVPYRVFPRWAVVTVAVALAFALGAIVIVALRPRSDRGSSARPASGETVEVLVQAATVDRPPDTEVPLEAPAASVSGAISVVPSAAPQPLRKKSDAKSAAPATDLFRTPGF